MNAHLRLAFLRSDFVPIILQIVTVRSRNAGLDAVALKPAECDVREALSVPLDVVAIDYDPDSILHRPGHNSLGAAAGCSNIELF